MPKRSTLTFTSEDGPAGDAERLRVYYCNYSGKPAFTTDCKIDRLPKRKTDNATILDTQRHLVKLYTTDGGVKLIGRRNGNVERQFRLNVDALPVAYRSEEQGRYLYIMDQAVSAFVSGHQVETKGETPVPPCIVAGAEESCQIIVEAEDKGTKAALLKISADAVRISIVSSASHEQAHNEILKLFGKVLGCRSMQLTVTKGRTTRQKIVSVQGLSIQEVYNKLQAAKPAETVRPINTISEVMSYD